MKKKSKFIVVRVIFRHYTPWSFFRVIAYITFSFQTAVCATAAEGLSASRH